MNKQHLILHLSLIRGAGTQAINRLIKLINQEKETDRWYAYRVQDFVRFGVGQKTAQKIVEGLADIALLSNELDLIKKNNVAWATILDDQYPEMLKHIHIPPVVLYWWGEPAWQTHEMIAFVGARKGNTYGERAVNALVPSLVAHGYGIASGGAYGIDTMAHQTTMACDGKTIIVLGAGLLQPYLCGNRSLLKKVIAAGGTVVSSFALQEQANTWTFPIRNRIIAGLSQGCVVVQAAKKSGALITASHALQEGRQVFAVPGPFDDTLSQGCNKLLQEGAKLVQNAQDILEEFGVIEEPEQVVIVQKEPEHPLLAHCLEPISIVDLSQKTGAAVTDLEQQLFALQLEGKVTQDFAGLWKGA